MGLHPLFYEAHDESILAHSSDCDGGAGPHTGIARYHHGYYGAEAWYRYRYLLFTLCLWRNSGAGSAHRSDVCDKWQKSAPRRADLQSRGSNCGGWGGAGLDDRSGCTLVWGNHASFFYPYRRYAPGLRTIWRT